MWYVYIIKSKEELKYTGIAKNLNNRLKDHNSGKSFYTKRGSDWKLVYSEQVNSLADARKREKYTRIQQEKNG